MTTRISGRAGQNNPHRGGEFRSENRFASKHVLATLKSRTTAEARIWVREIIVVVLSFNFFELHPGDVRVSLLLLHLSSAKIELAQMSQWLISATSRRGRLQRRVFLAEHRVLVYRECQRKGRDVQVAPLRRVRKPSPGAGIPSPCVFGPPPEADGAAWIKNVVYQEVIIEDT